MPSCSSLAPRAAALGAIALFSASPVSGQEVTGACARPASVVVRGLSRVTEPTALGDVGLSGGNELSTLQLQGAVRRLYASGQYEDVRVSCEIGAGGAATIAFVVRERPLLASVDVTGAEAGRAGAVRGKVDLLVGRPLDPAQVTAAMARIDSIYAARGYYLVRVKPESTVTSDGQVSLLFRIDEGRRLAVSGVRVNGNARLDEKDIVGAMETRPEGFLWFRRGRFDEEKYAGDLTERLPALYASRGFIDFEVQRDTVLIDRERGKAYVDITVKEGPQYKVGEFEVVDNRRFSTDELQRFYPFTGEGPTFSERVTGALRGRFGSGSRDVFDQKRWEEATERVSTAYRNEGYIYARVNPVVERVVGADSQPRVNLRWQVDERSPAIINRVDIAGNDYTADECIRRQLLIVPGDVFNQDRLLRSWQNVGNLGFFETPLPFPDTRQANDNGDIDLVFRVKERRTGSVNFGASMGGGGIGVGGFIGVDQPNLFGQCKRGSLNWNFGRIFNDFNVTYSDPAIRKSRVSGTLNAYHSQSRFVIRGIDRSLRTGGNLRFGFPVPGSYFTTLGVSYGAENTTLSGVTSDDFIGLCTSNCFRSNLGLDLSHDTRVDLPFASAGGLQTVTADFTGGPLGGTVAYQRYTGEFRSYATLAQFGGGNPGSQPIKLVLGLTGRAGALFGDPGSFFQYQSFSVGGVMFGQQLRGYPEFSITPRGFDPTAESFTGSRSAFGNAYLTVSGEVGLRFNQMVYLNAFYDAGNNFARPLEFNPGRLFRGAGVGVSVVTPLGPLGLDWAYGFDRTSVNPLTGVLQRDPKWQLHFKLGQLF